MARPSHRQHILDAGLELIHERGFAASSVRDIITAAGVPQGSFTNHFPSKEAFGLAVLEAYEARSIEGRERTLRNEALAPLKRLEAYLDDRIKLVNRYDAKRGCLLGNLSAESAVIGEPTRERLEAVLGDIRKDLEVVLKAAQKDGSLSKKADPKATALLIQSSIQGAMLMSRAERSPMPMKTLKKSLFATVLVH